jgi:phospholipase C
VPAVVVSPYVAAGSVLRNGVQGGRPFDHTSIIRTLIERFDPTGTPLTDRDAVAPSLDAALTLIEPSNDGPDLIETPSYTPTPDEVSRAKNMPPNDLQRSLCALSARLPQAGADIMEHIQNLQRNLVAFATPEWDRVADARSLVEENVKSFLGDFA